MLPFKHIAFLMLMLVASAYNALAQNLALSPFEGSVHTYSWNGITQGSSYTFYVTANNEGQTGQYDFIGGNSGVIGSNGIASAQIQWNIGSSLNQFEVWLVVSSSGCSNSIFFEVSPQPNNRTICFDAIASADCFDLSGNNFTIPLLTADNSGQPIPAVYFPLLVEFTVDGNTHLQQVDFDNQYLNIKDDWFNATPDQITDVVVTFTNATDSNGDPVQPEDGKTKFTQTIMAVPVVQFDTGIPDTIELNTFYTFKAFSNSDYLYEWWYTNESGTRFNFTSTTDSTEQHFWDTEGNYTLFVMVRDTVGCLSDVIFKPFVVTEKIDYWMYATAGRDTVLGSCNPYILQGWTSDKLQLSYSWEPAGLLDDPHSPHPVFVPGETTIFKLYISDSNGKSDHFFVTITVSETRADAGEDVFMYNNSSIVLDGSASTGTDLRYYWGTSDGSILNGGHTANPVVNKVGTYYLGVIDRFDCTSVDSVKVGLLSQAPIAQDDYDTTAYQTEVKIRVLANDSDPENDIDPLSLNLKNPPFNGTAYVDYDDYTIHYRPNTGFGGNDSFEYEICDTHSSCSDALVYVMVTDFKIFIPDAFSPNGDGINDYFEIVGIQWYEGNSLEIFNPWGNKVYQAKNYGISTSPKFWDGKSNTGVRLGNDELPTGTYFYVLDLGNGEKRIAGSVYLDR